MATFRDIKKEFFNLEIKEQEKLLKELYNFSKDTKQFLNTRVMNDGEDTFIDEINEATDYYTSSGIPKNLSPRKINSIISKAKKSKVNNSTLEEMELIAFKSYMDSLNDFGGGPEIYEDKVYDHLKNYLELVLNNSSKSDIDNKINEIKNYLYKHQNMYYDHIWELFQDLTGLEVD